MLRQLKLSFWKPGDVNAHKVMKIPQIFHYEFFTQSMDNWINEQVWRRGEDDVIHVHQEGSFNPIIDIDKQRLIIKFLLYQKNLLASWTKPLEIDAIHRLTSSIYIHDQA